MALKSNEEFKGFEVNGAYVKLNSVLASVSVYKDDSKEVLLETKNVHLDVNSAQYGELKAKKYPEAEDVLEEGQEV